MDNRRHRSYSPPPHGSGSGKKQKCSGGKGFWISRCNPSNLIQTAKNFTLEQCDLIRRNGFGGLLNLKCRKNPPHLLYHWLAKHFNCATSELVFSNGTVIPVTAKSVQLILGIPYGNRKVKYEMDAQSTALMKQDYYSDGLPSRITSIVEQLSEMRKADDRFLRTFLLLAMSCFLCPTTSCRISPRCFPSLVDISSVAQLDWCDFVLKQLVSSIKRYKHRLTICGCMFFLAVSIFASIFCVYFLFQCMCWFNNTNASRRFIILIILILDPIVSHLLFLGLECGLLRLSKKL
ncbi:hypothetical protein SEVIR_9G495800v4 [Setaria viridis]